MSEPASASASPVRPRPLFGRDRERSRLRSAFAAAVQGHGCLVLIGGEAGIGKTALVEDLAATATALGALVLTGHCYDLSATPPYGPWVELARHYQPTDDLPDAPAFLSDAQSLAALGSQERLFQAVAEFFFAVAAARPLVLILDDLHWADQGSLDLLRFLARELAEKRLLLLVTHRSEEPTRRHPLTQLLPLLVREARTDRLSLLRLDDAAIAALVAARYALPPAEADRLVTWLTRRSEGHPLYARELLHTLEDERALTEAEVGWRLSDLSRVRVPRLVREVIEARLARLDEAARELLELAAVIGQEAPVDLWQEVSGTSDGAILAAADGATITALAELTPDGAVLRFSHALVREALYESILPLRRRAWHRAIAATLAGMARPDPDAMAYHLQAAGDPGAAEWLLRSGERALRAYAWVTAATRFEAALPLLEVDPAAAQRHGWVLYYLGHMVRFSTPTRGLRYLDSAHQIGRDEGDRVLAALALAAAGCLRCRTGEVERGIAEMEAGVVAERDLTAHEWGEAHRWLMSLVDPTPTLNVDDSRLATIARLTSGHESALAVWLSVATLRYREAAALSNSLLAEVESLDQDELRRHSTIPERGVWIDCYEGLAFASAVLGQVEAAERGFARGTVLYPMVGHHLQLFSMTWHRAWFVLLPYRTEDRAARIQAQTAFASSALPAGGAVSANIAGELANIVRLPISLLEGDWSSARDALRMIDAVEINTSLHLPAEIAAATIARAQGDAERAMEIVRRRLPRGPDSDPCAAPLALYLFDLARLGAMLALDAGDVTAAQDWLAAHDRWLDTSGRVLGRADSRLLWAEVHRMDGDRAAARAAAEEALALASMPRQPLALIGSYRLLGRLATEERRFAVADERLTTSVELAESCTAPFERALTLLELAHLRIAQRQTGEARTLLFEVRAICEPLEAKPTLARVAALEADLGRPRASYPAGLSPREVEVLRLVSQGLTDPEVAAQLYLSRRTVSQHLRSVYNKLGVSSRAAATRVAVEHGLI